MKYAEPGSVSHGTLREKDLIEAFTDALEALLERNPDHLYRANMMALMLRAEAAQPETDVIAEVIADLMDALEEFAPPNCYFGAHEGDGSDFGFWPIDGGE